MVRGNVHREHVGDGLVKPFRQAISLGMVGGCQLVLRVARAEEVVNNPRQEVPATVGKELTGSTVL